MTSRYSTYARIARRETHSSRSTAAVTVAAVIILLLVWIATESVLVVIHGLALLAAPTAVITAIAEVTSVPQPLLIGGGIVIGLLGVLLIVMAILPGARARHRLPSGRCAVIVDDKVIANAIVRRVSFENALDPEQLTVYLGRRQVDVRVVPSSGIPVDRAEIRETVADEIERYNLRLRARVVVANEGRLV